MGELRREKVEVYLGEDEGLSPHPWQTTRDELVASGGVVVVEVDESGTMSKVLAIFADPTHADEYIASLEYDSGGNYWEAHGDSRDSRDSRDIYFWYQGADSLWYVSDPPMGPFDTEDMAKAAKQERQEEIRKLAAERQIERGPL